MGFRSGQVLVGSNSLYFRIVYLGLSLALIILIDEPGWIVLLGFGHCLMTGLLLSWMDKRIAVWRVVVVIVWIITSSFLSQREFKTSGRQLSGLLFVDYIFFTFGWVMIDLGRAPDWIRIPWITIGMIFFGIILVIEFQKASYPVELVPNIALAARVYLISLICFWILGLQ